MVRWEDDEDEKPNFLSSQPLNFYLAGAFKKSISKTNCVRGKGEKVW